MITKARGSWLFCGFFFLAGCATTTTAPASSGPATAGPGDKQSVAEEAAIASAFQALNSKKANYTIEPVDLLHISVFEQKDLDREVRVGQNGTISLPLIGTVKVGGLAVAEAEALVADKLRDYLISPQVSLFIKEYGNKKIFILGEVKRPGSVDLPAEDKLTVLEAITLAGGFTAIAAPDRTKVMRLVDGKSQSFTIEISAITHRGQKQKDISLEPNDVVYVPQSFF